MFHTFSSDISQIPLPEQFTYPFDYTPHPLCILASREVCQILSEHDELANSLQKEGKMFGVLIVSDENGELGFLAAFSGLLNGRSRHPYFVPPVYDLQAPESFFQKEEAEISALNKEIATLENSERYTEMLSGLQALENEARQTIETSKARLKRNKEKRKELRSRTSDPSELNRLDRESQFEKAEHKRLERHYDELLRLRQKDIAVLQTQLERLKHERKRRSNDLQQRIFRSFHFLNYNGQSLNLMELFQNTVQHTPPAGAGECAAPRLLQYAYLHHYTPLAMAEFWKGASPENSIRQDGLFYPSCSGKCGPILSHMLQGLSVEAPPDKTSRDESEIKILYEDEWLVVLHKPSGLLSVPGKDKQTSVFAQLRTRYPQATGPLIVHRLDMDTSGIMIAAKTKEVHRELQKQFEKREIKKQYTALLDGTVTIPCGCISLPLCPDPTDRPRQIVDYVNGKPAETLYKVTGYNGTRTRVQFSPLTGRTHQIRVHAAHQAGIGIPIAGDTLYGKKADRLYLQASEIRFFHPVKLQDMNFRDEAEF